MSPLEREALEWALCQPILEADVDMGHVSYETIQSLVEKGWLRLPPGHTAWELTVAGLDALERAKAW